MNPGVIWQVFGLHPEFSFFNGLADLRGFIPDPVVGYLYAVFSRIAISQLGMDRVAALNADHF